MFFSKLKKHLFLNFSRNCDGILVKLTVVVLKLHLESVAILVKRIKQKLKQTFRNILAIERNGYLFSVNCKKVDK